MVWGVVMAEWIKGHPDKKRVEDVRDQLVDLKEALIKKRANLLSQLEKQQQLLCFQDQ